MGKAGTRPYWNTPLKWLISTKSKGIAAPFLTLTLLITEEYTGPPLFNGKTPTNQANRFYNRVFCKKTDSF